ncbi:MAG: cation transporter [Acidobacteria bacterium]|nr:cation transporter [Acidobacteriota bacterium]MYG76661.1 cation transporter [Acidobacteriota bacterium]
MSHHHHHDALTPGHGGKMPSRRALGAALLCTLTIAVAEFVGGIIANSLALQGDAGHMLSDAGALGVSFFAAWLATRPMTARRTFGFHRAEVLAALANSVFLLGIAGWVGVRAVSRLGHPVEVAAVPVLIIATIGLVVNLIALKILGHHRQGNLNIRGAFLHVLGDTLGSVGVIVSAIVIQFTGWTTVDSLASLGIAGLLAVSGGRLLRDSVSVLMLATPANVDSEAVRSGLLSLPGVIGIHDLHIWTVNSGFVSLTCHADIEADTSTDALLRSATQLLRERFGIRHVTIQPEVTRVHGDGDSCQILAT